MQKEENALLYESLDVRATRNLHWAYASYLLKVIKLYHYLVGLYVYTRHSTLTYFLLNSMS
jgi:hypothetical protein